MTEDFFGPLYGIDHVPEGDEDLLLYWAIPASRDIANFIWDTDVPEVTKAWPAMEPASIRDAIAILTKREDVTGYLYSLQELEEYRPGCKNCGDSKCRDKWCGLRGDEGADDDAELGHADTPGAGEPVDVGGGGGPVPGGPEDRDPLGRLG